jgi:hypothetical protein
LVVVVTPHCCTIVVVHSPFLNASGLGQGSESET